MSDQEKPWKDMRKGRPAKGLSLDAELDLIRKAQNGDKRAMHDLLVYYEAFVQSVAKKVAWFTGATKMLEDLAQHGRIALFEKTLSYDFEYIEKRRKENPKYFAARLSSYAHREVKRRMLKEACNNLEIVRIPMGTQVQKAHRELDYGGDPVEIAQRLGLREDKTLIINN